tara:strand:- start:1150 stop:1848 length:699 start_codon:yes stop_codon:yes gene_type:complete
MIAAELAMICARYFRNQIVAGAHAEKLSGSKDSNVKIIGQESLGISSEIANFLILARNKLVNFPLFIPLLHHHTIILGLIKNSFIHVLASPSAGNLTIKEFKLAKILFADDDALLGDVVFHKLESCGHQVTVVDNGYNVLSAALRVRPDIIILDNLMPGLTGPEVMPNLKRDVRTSSVPVLVLTSQTNKHDMTNAYRAGAADYMAKPFSPEDLANRISALLDSPQSLQQVGL